MEFVLDMVHDNPGEERFKTSFNAEKLSRYGFNGQVFKHINCVATFDSLGENVFPVTNEEKVWHQNLVEIIRKEINQAKSQGMQVFYHVDLFVLPKRLVQKYSDQICDPITGKISIDMPFTFKIHAVLIDEIFRDYPEVDGLIVRVGETYLQDTPFHTGNSPIDSTADIDVSKKQYVKLLNFLRDKICVKQGKFLMFRTWDLFPDRFHSNPDYYLDVTGQVERHDKLLFSIKYTASDFWRWVKFNPCLCQGKHGQIVEVQSQREYEGKGAYPFYSSFGAINGSSELSPAKGLKDVKDNSNIRGVYNWSRGGGWHGPYIKNELWCDLNTYVIGEFAKEPDRDELDIFNEYCSDVLELKQSDLNLLRRICLMAEDAILKGRYCQAYDERLDGVTAPTQLWMRDDVLAGLSLHESSGEWHSLSNVFKYLYENGLFEKALAEKTKSVEIWEKANELSNMMQIGGSIGDYISISTLYGLKLFKLIECGWCVMAEGYNGDRSGEYNLTKLQVLVSDYERSLKEYQSLPELSAQCATLYRTVGWHFPNQKPGAGIGNSIEKYSNILKRD